MVACKELDGQNVDLGAPLKDLSGHSLRKVSDSYVATHPSGPGSAAAARRAGHSSGKINDVYQLETEQGDRFVGRCLSGHDMTDPKFASTPPAFDTEGLRLINDEIGWPNIISNYEDYNESFKRIMPYLLASLLYHSRERNLGKIYSKDHPIFKQKLFTQLERSTLEELYSHIFTDVNYCKETDIRVTGINTSSKLA